MDIIGLAEVLEAHVARGELVHGGCQDDQWPSIKADSDISAEY